MGNKALNKDQIINLLPHREPMLLIDELIDIVPNKSAVGVINVKKECFFFLQPNILHKRNKTVFVQVIANHFISNNPLLDKIYNDYFDIIISQNKNNICDLRRIFNNTNDNIFLDELHVNSIGNLIIAKEIYNIINKENNLC